MLNSLRKIKVPIVLCLMFLKTSRDWCHSRQDYPQLETGTEELRLLSVTDISTSTLQCSTQRWFLGLCSLWSLGDGAPSKSVVTIMSVSKIMENVEILSTTNSRLWKFLNLSCGTDPLERKKCQTIRKSTNNLFKTLLLLSLQGILNVIYFC